MELIPIKQTNEENTAFINDRWYRGTIRITIEFYKKNGFIPPWICYLAVKNGKLVGSGGFKGKPHMGRVEIAYSTLEPFRQQGIGTSICGQLVKLSLAADPSVKITARTLREHNFSVKILKKNNFVFNGTVNDPDDGKVWEWKYKAN